MSDHHYVSKGFIKYWQPSFDKEMANRHKSNGGVYIHDFTTSQIKYRNNLQKIFSYPFLNLPQVEASISKYIEQPLGGLTNIAPIQKGLMRSTLSWKQFRAITLLTLLQPSRIPGNNPPLINQVLSKDEVFIDQLALGHQALNQYFGVKLPDNIMMFLNEVGFFVFPVFDFRDHQKVLKAKATSDIWGVAVPVRPDTCIVSVSKSFADTNWIFNNLHIFQTYSVGLVCKELIVPPRLRNGGEMFSSGKLTPVKLNEMMNILRAQVKATDDLVQGYFQLAGLIGAANLNNLAGLKP